MSKRVSEASRDSLKKSVRKLRDKIESARLTRHKLSREINLARVLTRQILDDYVVDPPDEIASREERSTLWTILKELKTTYSDLIKMGGDID